MAGIPGFIFEDARSRLAETLDPGTATLYVRLLLGIPAITMEAVAEANIFESAGFQYLSVTGWDGALLEASPVLFPALNSGGERVRGFLVCEQAGSSPATDDPLVCFGILRGQESEVLMPEFVGESLRITFPDGVFSIEDGYVYHALDYQSGDVEAATVGIFHLLGTENYTKTYANPLFGFTATTYKAKLDPGTNGSSAASSLTTKNTSVQTFGISQSGQRRIAFDFKSSANNQRRVRVGRVGGRRNQNLSGENIKIFGSNSVPTLSNANVDNTSLWTLLCDQTINITTNVNFFIDCYDPNYWACLKIETQGLTAAYAFEFFDSYILSPNQNLVD
ncbi:hypothetical protein GS597_01485 [Synechococcales cyanobacterium C]|uniref:Uncharacterized protein n=1 Tax=Petrachloros mirabilis ULC683 TaxID=2781853 RepID=A0A8K1ZX04_9CYAN|nr:hypothetical protein [Petrachloros mirabilis]NCJ05212.1 hypothetical protein [Petrachloros mirabilis ULC683]